MTPYTQKAIERAIEGGYEPFFSKKMTELKIEKQGISAGDFYADVGVGMPYRRTVNGILLDPLFWQCLGKSEGWREPKKSVPIWQVNWHRFIDHLVSGGSIEEYFKSIISKK